MTEIKILLFDDFEEPAASRWINRVKNSVLLYATESGLGPIDCIVDHISQPDDVDTALRSGEVAEYDIFVCDLLVLDEESQTEKYDGWQYIERARNVSEALAIVAWTQADRTIKEEELLELGADAFQAKAQVEKRADYIRFGEKMLEALRKRKGSVFTANIRIDFDNSDFQHLDLIEKLSLPVLEDLCFQAFKQLPPISEGAKAAKTVDEEIVANLNVIQPGLSGAGVFWVKFEPTGIARLIKYSKSENDITKELEGRKKLDFFGSLFIKSATNELMHAGDNFGIAMPFSEGSTSFLEWIRSPSASRKSVDSLLRRMWLEDGFMRSFSEPVVSDGKYFNQRVLDILTVGHRARIVHFLSEIERVDASLPEELRQSIDTGILMDFLNNGRIGNLRNDRFSDSVVLVDCHGDFHCGNILVSSTGYAEVIDPPSISKNPWTSDLARFFVDIAVRGIDDSFRVHLFDGIEIWMDILSQVFDGGKIEKFPDHVQEGAVHTLNWINANLCEIALFHKDNEETARIEFRIGILVELLRAVYRYEWYTMQQRFFSCKLAVKILEDLDSSLG